MSFELKRIDSATTDYLSSVGPDRNWQLLNYYFFLPNPNLNINRHEFEAYPLSDLIKQLTTMQKVAALINFDFKLAYNIITNDKLLVAKKFTSLEFQDFQKKVEKFTNGPIDSNYINDYQILRMLVLERCIKADVEHANLICFFYFLDKFYENPTKELLSVMNSLMEQMKDMPAEILDILSIFQIALHEPLLCFSRLLFPIKNRPFSLPIFYDSLAMTPEVLQWLSCAQKVCEHEVDSFFSVVRSNNLDKPRRKLKNIKSSIDSILIPSVN